MRILITNLFGSFEAKIIEYLHMGKDVAGFRAVVVDSKLNGWRNGETIECGTLTKYRKL